MDEEVLEDEGLLGVGVLREGRVQVGCVEVGCVDGCLNEGKGGGCGLREQERETKAKELQEHRGVSEWTGPLLTRAKLCARFRGSGVVKRL